MSKCVIYINIIIVIRKIVFLSRIIRRINVNDINLALVCFFKELERCKVVAFDKEIHLSAVVDEEVGLLGQDGYMCFKRFVNRLAVLLEDEAVFLALYVFHEFVEILE